MASEKMKVLPLDEQIELLLKGKAHEEPCEISDNETFELPPWFDEKKYKRGQNYMNEHIFSQFTNALTGLICVLAVPSILNILISTHKSSNTATAFKRYMSTLFHVYCWYHDDLKPGTDAWRSLMAVRNRHFRASKSSKTKGLGHISQRDMVYTQFGFFALGLLAPEKVGFSTDNEDDIEGFIHFWQTIGYMLGIEDRYNLCRPSVVETKEICNVIRREVTCHYLRYPPEYFLHMVSAIMEAMWYYSPMLSEGSFMYFAMWFVGVKDYSYNSNMKHFSVKYVLEENKDAMLINNNNVIAEQRKYSATLLEKELGSVNKFLLNLLVKLHCNFVRTKFGRTYLRYHTTLSMFLLKNFPFLSFWRFGVRGAFIDMFKEDVPVKSTVVSNKDYFSTVIY